MSSPASWATSFAPNVCPAPPSPFPPPLADRARTDRANAPPPSSTVMSWPVGRKPGAPETEEPAGTAGGVTVEAAAAAIALLWLRKILKWQPSPCKKRTVGVSDGPDGTQIIAPLSSRRGAPTYLARKSQSQCLKLDPERS
eukprot:7591149-Pyramimonas_sp.AAC.1